MEEKEEKKSVVQVGYEPWFKDEEVPLPGFMPDPPLQPCPID